MGVGNSAMEYRSTDFPAVTANQIRKEDVYYSNLKHCTQLIICYVRTYLASSYLGILMNNRYC